MKTLKVIKITSVLQIIFCLFCIASSVCFYFYDYCFSTNPVYSGFAFTLGNLFVYGWIANPVGIISLFVCLYYYKNDKKQESQQKIIGKKWHIIVYWPIITKIFYFAASIFMGRFTGGV